MKILLDCEEFKKKPHSIQAARISKRIAGYEKDVDMQDIAKEVVKGKSFVPISVKKINGKVNRDTEHWQSQEIICLDFDNEKAIVDPNNPKKKIKIKDIKMTLEQAREEFKNTAAFIYTSFNHKPDHHKFRVVFVLDTVVYDRFDIIATYKQFEGKYPYIDTNCLEVARMFFGGKELYELNYNNRIPVVKADSEFIHKNTHRGVYTHNTVVNNKEIIEGVNPPSKSHFDHLELIRNKDKNFAKLIRMEFEPVTFNNRQEVYHYLKQINLHDYLGIYDTSCYDIFHDEANRSGSIYQDSETGYWWYKCWSEFFPFVGTIIDITERLTDDRSKPKTLKWLMSTFNITLEKTEWQMEQEELWQMNKEFLDDDELIKEAYPYLDSIMRSPLYYALTRELHEIALNIVTSLNKHDGKENAVFYASIKHIMKRMNRYYDFEKYQKTKEKRVCTILSLLVYLQMLERIDLDQLPAAYAERAKEAAEVKGYSNTITFYSIPSYDAGHMVRVEQLAKQFKDSHMTVGNFGRQMLYQTLGEEETNRVFPMQKEKKISDFNQNTCNKLENTLLKYIDEYGWVTEDRIINNTKLDIDVEKVMRSRDKALKDKVVTEEDKKKWEYRYKHSQFKKMLGGLLNKHGLTMTWLKKDLMEMKQIPILYNEDGNECYPKVIYK